MTPKSSFGGAFGLYNLGLTYYVFFYCHKMAPFQIYAEVKALNRFNLLFSQLNSLLDFSNQ